jgi:hypothetical protein
LSSVSPGPAIAKTRVAAPAEIPIQIDSIGRFLAVRLDRHCGGRALGDDDDRRLANFSTTSVRFYFSLASSEAPGPNRRRPSTPEASPVPPLRLTAIARSLRVVAPVRAVDVSVIAATAQVK